MAIVRLNPSKITSRDIFNYLLTADVDDEVKDYAQKEINKLNARNEHRASTPTKAQKANLAVEKTILAYLETVPYALASEIAAACEISTQKATALCRVLAEQGKVSVSDVKVKGKGSLKSYSIVEGADDGKDDDE